MATLSYEDYWVLSLFSLEHALHSDINILGSSPGMPVVVACLPISLVAY